MRVLILYFLVFLPGLQACATSKSVKDSSIDTATSSTEKVMFSNCKQHLEAVANCFFKVVSLTQQEPKEDETLARFLGKATWTIAAGDVHETCTPLGLDAQSERLALSDGSEIRADRFISSRDEMAGGQTVWHITYRFSGATCPDKAEANLELWMGGPR